MSTQDETQKTTDQPVTAAGADAHKHDDEPGVAEPDRVNVGMLVGITLAIAIATIAVVIGVREFFSQTLQGEVQSKVLEPEDPMKKELYLVEQAKLSKYQWISQKDGVVRIPLARAKELVLADYGKMAAYRPGAPAAAGTTAPPPAPETSASAASSVAPSGSGSGAPMPSVAPSTSAAASASAPATKTSASAPAPKASGSAPPAH